MKSKLALRIVCLVCFFAHATLVLGDTQKCDDILRVPPQTLPEFKILDQWQGTWDVKASRRVPAPAMVTYVETFQWVLDGRFLRGETSKKSDGVKQYDGEQGMSMATYDVCLKAYRFWTFDSKSVAVELPAPNWRSDTRTMEWTSSVFSPVAFNSRVTFPDRNTIVWSAELKDWKGTVLLDVEGVSVRRK